MEWTKPLTILVVVGLAGFVVGALIRLLTSELVTDVRAQAVLALLIALVLVVSVIAARSRQWLAGPYW